MSCNCLGLCTLAYPNSSLFYWLIKIWLWFFVLVFLCYGIFFIADIGAGGPGKPFIYTLHTMNWLFVYAAILNLPVRLNQLRDLQKERRGDTLGKESDLIFERLELGTRCFIVWFLLFNSLFQITHQILHFVFDETELVGPGGDNIVEATLGRLFFIFAMWAAIIAAWRQAVAENRFQESHQQDETNSCKSIFVESCRNFWTHQTQGQLALAIKFENKPPNWDKIGCVDIRRRTVHGRKWEDLCQGEPREEIPGEGQPHL